MQSQKRMEELGVGKVRFLGEQDGPAEKFLKDQLIALFGGTASVMRAYLARVNLGGGTGVSVILGLRTQHGADKALAERVGSIFGSVFSATEYLDIVFLTGEQETELAKVCKAFFTTRNSDPV
jgi:hypothetical protein